MITAEIKLVQQTCSHMEGLNKNWNEAKSLKRHSQKVNCFHQYKNQCNKTVFKIIRNKFMI